MRTARSMSKQVGVKLHPSMTASVTQHTDPRSHLTSDHYYHFVKDDDPALLAFVAEGYAARETSAVYAYVTAESGGGRCLKVAV